MDESGKKAPRRPWLRRACAAIAATVLALLLAEGGMRVRQLVKFGTLSPEVSATVLHEPSGLQIPVPGRVAGGIRIDSRGFRNDELEVPKPAGRIRIAFVGASTTFCAEASGNGATWPSLVRDRLREAFPGADFDYVNASVPGYAVEHSIRNLEHRVRELAPDVIVVYHAANDMSRDTRKLAREAGLFEGDVDESSSLAKASVLWSWIEKNVRVRRRMQAAREGTGRLSFDEATVAQGFRGDLETLLRASKEVAPVVAVATFCWQVRPEMPPDRQIEACNTAFYYMPWMNVEGFLKAQRAYNAAIREAAAAAGAALLDGENEIPGDREHFADSVHYNDNGCRAMAERISKRLIALPELQDLVRTRD